MKEKHSPAPWTIDYGYVQKETELKYFQINSENHAVCSNHFCFSDEVEANAHLIAAAPDLLEALEGLMRRTDWHDAVTSDARAAIRKAKGQTND